MKNVAADSIDIRWHDEPRARLRHLFELADDSLAQIDDYIELGRVLVACNTDGEVVGHVQLIPSMPPGVVELKSIAVREDRQ